MAKKVMKMARKMRKGKMHMKDFRAQAKEKFGLDLYTDAQKRSQNR